MEAVKVVMHSTSKNFKAREDFLKQGKLRYKVELILGSIIDSST